MIIADYHTHTSFSSDSQSNPEDMLQAAIKLGLQQYCFTDHMDYRYPHPDFGTFTFDVDEYFQTMTALKEKYKNQIDVRIGIELGLRNEPEVKEDTRTYYQQLINKYPFDFVIGSSHVLWNYDPYYKEFWTNHSVKEGISEYFKAITHNASYYDMFLICGHLDYIIRYIPEEKKEYNTLDYLDLIDEMLTTIIKSGKGIECNTSGFKYQLGVPHPKPDLLKRYLELGGELITIGSDAHKPEHIAYDFNRASDLLSSLGYRYYSVFKDKKATMIKL